MGKQKMQISIMVTNSTQVIWVFDLTIWIMYNSPSCHTTSHLRRTILPYLVGITENGFSHDEAQLTCLLGIPIMSSRDSFSS